MSVPNYAKSQQLVNNFVFCCVVWLEVITKSSKLLFFNDGMGAACGGSGESVSVSACVCLCQCVSVWGCGWVSECRCVCGGGCGCGRIGLFLVRWIMKLVTKLVTEMFITQGIQSHPPWAFVMCLETRSLGRLKPFCHLEIFGEQLIFVGMLSIPEETTPLWNFIYPGKKLWTSGRLTYSSSYRTSEYLQVRNDGLRGE